MGRTISQMKKGDTLIVSEVSQLSRNLTDIMTIMGTCLKKGINSKSLYINNPDSDIRIFAKTYTRDMAYTWADNTPVVVEFGYEKVK